MKQFALILILALWGQLTQAQSFERIEGLAKLNTIRHTAGVAVADFDGDLDLDVFFVAKQDYDKHDDYTWSRLYANNNDGTFTDVTAAAGLSAIYDYDEPDPGWEYGVKMGVAWGDYDNDGFPDLFLTHYKRNLLYHNNQDGTFTEVTLEAGISQEDSCYHTSAVWWDIDQDGWLDLYVSKWGFCASNTCYLNRGNGTFQEATTSFNLGGKQAETWMAMPLDANLDGRVDLYLANDFSANELFIQDSSFTFTNQANAYQVDKIGNDMGITIGDCNNDGRFDLFITNISDNRLLIQNPDYTYSDLAQDWGVLNAYWAWGTRFADFDHDGDEDLFVANGYQNDQLFFPVLNTNFLYENLHNQGLDTFRNRSEDWGVATSSHSMGLEVFDYDNDGDQDILVSNMDDFPYLYENKLAASHANWVKVQLKGTTSNYNGFGSTVTLYTSGKVQRRYVSGAGFLGQSIQPVHYGLGKHSSIDSISVKWPSGLRESYAELPVNQTIVCTENLGINTYRHAAQKQTGCTDPKACNYKPNAVIDDQSCTYLPAYPIMGDDSAGYLRQHTYHYPAQTGSSYHWEVINGEIINGQGTPHIDIKWGITDSGFVSVAERNGCTAKAPSNMRIDLKIEAIGDNIGVARLWNEVLLEAIRHDFARPTVHARNLFHASIAMYDAWAVYQEPAEPYFLGKTVGAYTCPFPGFISNESAEASISQTMSYAMYRLLAHRFAQSPGASHIQAISHLLMQDLGYDPNIVSVDFSSGDPAALGNYLAQELISFGLQDGSNEAHFYENKHYRPVNSPLVLSSSNLSPLSDPNRWQPLALETFIDQSGNLIAGSTPEFLSPEWGAVIPFALSPAHRQTKARNNHPFMVYHDPGSPPLLDTTHLTPQSQAYQWGFSLVSSWGAQLDPADSVLWDISPNGIGNLGPTEDLPSSFEAYPEWYLSEGGDNSPGHIMNPITSQPYPAQWVPRGDYTRVLAEFWADGPDSETPPGHWFVLLNQVSDHPLTQKRFNGKGEVLDPLEWEVKTYFVLGGAMHDAAIAAWSIKGWYDYIRPISAIRYMALRGQSSEPDMPHYDPGGIPLIPGYIEVIKAGDALAGRRNQHLGKIKLYTWRGHTYIRDPETDQAGVGWILAEDWMPYQRPSFVTPPFAGYVSGHSTYSRAAAEVMTLLTGDPYFPGGLGEFVAPKDEFLVFEEGPSQDIVLQWATYQDASDQCSLSRIWGGIHPPADDLPGRVIGEQVGKHAFDFAIPYFEGTQSPTPSSPTILYPNPIAIGKRLFISPTSPSVSIQLRDIQGRKLEMNSLVFHADSHSTSFPTASLSPGIYLLQIDNQVLKFTVY